MKLEVLQAEMVSAMKNKDRVRKETISSIIQAVQKFGIDNRCKDNITEDQIDAVILKEKKTCQEMIDTCPESRPDILESYKVVMSIIDEFAPKLMTDEAEIKAFITSLGIELTKPNRGKIMGALKGKADMKVANKIVASMLEG